MGGLTLPGGELRVSLTNQRKKTLRVQTDEPVPWG